MIDLSRVLDRPERIPNTDSPKEVGGLKITFGLDLDGYQDLQPRDRFNESICGPQGFLRLLELRLGLASKPAEQCRKKNLLVRYHIKIPRSEILAINWNIAPTQRWSPSGLKLRLLSLRRACPP